MCRGSALALALALLPAGCSREGRLATPPATLAADLPVVDVPAFIHAGARPLPISETKNPFAGRDDVARQGALLFVQMNCDGCHGDGATGAVGPNLGDGRFRYGGTDGALFQSIYEGRPNGMPAWGAVLGADVVWRLVTYVQSLRSTQDLATEDWKGEGNAAAMGH